MHSCSEMLIETSQVYTVRSIHRSLCKYPYCTYDTVKCKYPAVPLVYPIVVVFARGEYTLGVHMKMHVERRLLMRRQERGYRRHGGKCPGRVRLREWVSTWRLSRRTDDSSQWNIRRATLYSVADGVMHS